MAAIDKLYVNSWDKYCSFKEWCEQQPLMVDKYGKKEPITNYLYQYDECFIGGHPVFMAPCYIDAYLIRNCPFEYIQSELKFRYGEDYQAIKDGLKYTSPKASLTYEIGKHFKCIKHPSIKYNKPFRGMWFVDVYACNEIGFLWHHENTNTWDSIDDYVISDGCSSTTHCKTIKALKRLIRKWKFPIGTEIRVYGYFINETYIFKVTK